MYRNKNYLITFFIDIQSFYHFVQMINRINNYNFTVESTVIIFYIKLL